MNTFETTIDLFCHSSDREAQICAEKSAAVSGGMVLDIGGGDIKSKDLVFYGLIPRLLAAARFPSVYSEGLAVFQLRPTLPCSLYTTWNNILSSQNRLGFLVVSGQGTASAVSVIEPTEVEDEEHLLVSLIFDRILQSLPQRHLGSSYCLRCGKVIPPERIRVVPGAKKCVFCQSREERR